MTTITSAQICLVASVCLLLGNCGIVDKACSQDSVTQSTVTGSVNAELGESLSPVLRMSREEYRDRCEAIWYAQVVSVLMGWEFEHKVGAVQWVDSIQFPYSLKRIKEAGSCAPVDDDWYYEMANLNALEEFGTALTLEQLGQQWVENNVGVWGASGMARDAMLRGIKPPESGSPRFNRMWFTMGGQNRSDLYGMLFPGRPNEAAAMAREHSHIMAHAEGSDGGAFVAAMVSMAFSDTNHQQIIRRAVEVLDPRTPHRQCIEMVIRLADDGQSYQEVADAILDRWQLEYPATNNAVANAGIGVVALWFGDGDFLKSLNIGFSAADYADADCNATMATVVLAAMHGTKAIPQELLAPLHGRMRGDAIGHVKIQPPVDTTFVELARRTAAMGEKLIIANGGTIENDEIVIPLSNDIHTQQAELFHPNEFTKWWNANWKLDRAGFGAPGGGHRGIRGGTFLDGDVLATYPRDETRGVRFSRVVEVGDQARLNVEVAADPGRKWKLEVYADHDQLVSRIIDGGPANEWPGVAETKFPAVHEEVAKSDQAREFQTIQVDLSKYRGQTIVLRVYQHTLVRNAYPGNAYWRAMNVVNEPLVAGEVIFEDRFGQSSRGQRKRNGIVDPPPSGMGYKTTDSPFGFELKDWLIADEEADGPRCAFWCIPETESGAVEAFARQAGRSHNSIAYANQPVPADVADYVIEFRQWCNDNDYIGFIVGASAPTVDHDGTEFGYERQIPNTDKTVDDIYLRGDLGGRTVAGKALMRQWVTHRIEVSGNTVRWFQNGELMHEGTTPKPINGGYVGIRQRYERGTRYDDFRISVGQRQP